MPFQFLISSHIIKHEFARKSLLIFYIFNVFSITKETFIYTLSNKKYNFISIVKYFETSLPKFSTNHNFLGLHLHPHLLYHCAVCSRAHVTVHSLEINGLFAETLTIYVMATVHE